MECPGGSKKVLSISLFQSLVVVFVFSVFNQGDEGKSWYIILKGSVNVVIYGKVSKSIFSIILNKMWFKQQ